MPNARQIQGVVQALLVLTVASGCGLKAITSTGAVTLTMTGVPSAVVAGVPVSFTITAIDATGQPATEYAGTVSVTSSDRAAIKPSDYPFSAADEGIKTFASAFTFGTAGQQTLVVTDTSNPELVADTRITVAPASLHCIDFGGAPTTVAAGPGMSAAAPIKDMALNFSEDPVLVYLGGTPTATSAFAKSWAGTTWLPYGSTTVAPLPTPGSLLGAPSLALDTADHPNVAFVAPDASTADNRVVLMLRWTGSVWQGLDGSDAAAGMAGSLAAQATPAIALTLDYNNRPWVAWDHDDPNEVRARAWNGIAWTGQGNELLAATARHPALAVPPTGRTVAAWVDSNGLQPVIVAQQWNGTQWMPLGLDGVVSNGNGPVQSDRPSIAFSTSGQPVVAWEALNRAGVSNVYARVWTGAVWADLAGSGLGNGVSASSGSGAQHPALAVDGDNHIWLAWEDLRSGQIYLRQFTGSAWIEVGASASGGGVSSTSLTARWPTLRMTGRGVPILAWEETAGNNFVVHVCPWK